MKFLTLMILMVWILQVNSKLGAYVNFADKKEKEKELLREQEREEIEKRRALPEEQRHKEDLERADKTRAEKPKGQQKFLQKYWHKGAFHQVRSHYTVPRMIGLQIQISRTWKF